jgi:hypothetical protein
MMETKAVLARRTIAVELTAGELHLLIRTLEQQATRAAHDPEQIDFADWLYCRIAQLREATR